MKVKVNRLLTAGKFNVNFEVGDFTPDELSKMSSFGVPHIILKWTSKSGTARSQIAITQISKNFNAVFESAEFAKEYEDEVLAQIKTEMEQLRARKDEFSSSEEVDF